MIKIGIIREGKTPPDARAPLDPTQCLEAQNRFGVKIFVQPSQNRGFRDDEYLAHGIAMQDDLTQCDILLGVKEVPISMLIPGKTYMFFSHTVKKQPYNRGMLQAILKNKIRLIDYEMMTDDLGDRLIAFGFFAGLVGSHNGIWAYGRRSGLFTLPRMFQCRDYEHVLESYHHTHFPPMRIVLTGSGRVASGVIRNLHDMNIHQVSPLDFLRKSFDRPVFTQLFPQDYVEHRDGPRIFNKNHFYEHGEEYRSIFQPYYKRADIFVNAIYYDKTAPAFFSLEEMRSPEFKLQVIADISCDIAPDASVPTTLRPSTIVDPVYGFDPATAREKAAFQPEAVDIMAVDNLPSELPRDASGFFGRQLLDNVLPELLAGGSPMINRAMICENGHLTERYAYLSDYVGQTV